MNVVYVPTKDEIMNAGKSLDEYNALFDKMYDTEKLRKSCNLKDIIRLLDLKIQYCDFMGLHGCEILFGKDTDVCVGVDKTEERLGRYIIQ